MSDTQKPLPPPASAPLAPASSPSSAAASAAAVPPSRGTVPIPRPISAPRLQPVVNSAAAAAAKEAAALKRLTARLEQLDASTLEAPSVDPRTAAIAALMVANFVGDDEVKKRFEPLVKAKLLDANAIDDLPVAARFVLRILPKLGLEIGERGVEAPDLLLEVCRGRRDDLLKLTEKHLSDIDEAHGRIATVRVGTGMPDLVQDLRILADLLREYAEPLEKESAGFDRTWSSDARQLADELEEALLGDQGDEEREWRSYLLRAWAMLIPAYDEVCRAGRFLFFNDKPEARFPSLVAVTRVRRRIRREAVRRADSSPPPSIPLSARGSQFARERNSLPPEVSLVDLGEDEEMPSSASLADVGEAYTLDVDGGDEGHENAGPPIVPLAPVVITPEWNDPITVSMPPSPHTAVTMVPAGTSGPSSRAPAPEHTPVAAARAPIQLSVPPEPPSAESWDIVEQPIDLVPRSSQSRIGVELEVTYASESNFYTGLAESPDEVGLFMSTYVVKAVGSRMAVSLSLPEARDPLLVKGVVRWVREFSPYIETPPGMGILLQNLPPQHKREIDAFMKARAPFFYDD